VFFKKRKPKAEIATADISAETSTDSSRMQGEMFADAKSPDRKLSVQAATDDLRAGANHYRAYVGPPKRFDFMGATQFALLFQMGLRDNHKVLDFGCGSLRLGRILIPFLQKGGYFGIDPNKWLIDDGLENELGKDANAIKAPRFEYNIDFNCDVFDEKFDFIIAQSIMTHTGRDLFEAFLKSSAKCLKPNGIILFTCNPSDDPDNPAPAEGWHYPECVTYHNNSVLKLIEDADLVGKLTPWFHPASRWYCAALNPEALPDDEHMHHLTGAVLRQPQFKASLTRK